MNTLAVTVLLACVAGAFCSHGYGDGYGYGAPGPAYGGYGPAPAYGGYAPYGGYGDAPSTGFLKSFGTLGIGSFGLGGYSPEYVDLEAYDFNAGRNDAARAAPPGSRPKTRVAVIGRQYKSGNAHQYVGSQAHREGQGSGSAGVQVGAYRTANQNANQQFSQGAAGSGHTEAGAAYRFHKYPEVRYQPVPVQEPKVHYGKPVYKGYH